MRLNLWFDGHSHDEMVSTRLCVGSTYIVAHQINLTANAEQGDVLNNIVLNLSFVNIASI